MIYIAILGNGVVGSGVAEVLKKNSISIGTRAGEEIAVKYILDVRDFPDDPNRELLTKNPEDIFNDDSIKIIIETIGGTKIAYEFTKQAFALKKHVVTSNKELVATYGPELLKMAYENGVEYLFEASVGGGIPIIRPLNQCLAANIVNGVTGILNGTTNYVLSQMKRNKSSFKDALAGAQQKGYAEADATADIDGHDACRKIAILSSIAFNEFVDYRKIYTEGISKVSTVDMQYADAMDSVIKLIAISKRVGDKVFARVSPAIISKEHSLATVEDVYNAIVVKGDAIGEVMFYGRGAGKLPTASAVVADIIDIARHMDSGVRSVWKRKEYDNILDINQSETQFFIRVNTDNIDSAKKDISNLFEKVRYISINNDEIINELAFVTEKSCEADLTKKIKQLEGSEFIDKVISKIRIEEE